MKAKKYIWLIYLVLMTYPSYGQNANLMKDCIGKYMFNNNTLDDSPLKNNGKDYGVKFTADRTGKPNSACHFGGNGEYIEIYRNISNDFTICFWVKTIQVGFDGEDGAFYGSTGMIDNECVSCGNDFGVDLIGNRAIFGIDNYQLPSTRYINSGQWIHIAAVRDSTQKKMFLYLNGVLDTTLHTPEYVRIEAEPTIYFGKLHHFTGDEKPFFNGDLDDICIFSRALSSSEILEIASDGNKQSEFVFNGSNVDINVPIVLRNIQFLIGKSDLLAAGKEELNYVVKWLNENPEVNIELSGHTSIDGNKAFNDRLSQARSESCKNYLISKGVVKNRISSKGYGSDNPLVSNETVEGRQANRRVELKIILN